ncbi:pro-sigmaK processing inhibitor BofA family protein [Garciella nitratireducens]|uniref:Inhibitor of the pro-sigma K processing machinery n=1 Tax=Garciella nitratireducens DSM 15102 TaxID=1121911 RepID=A0A1T4NGM6_9FIRM|nr:pro-sigmaK processing inhibitor BofA family protein [Garciella nitratireducens]SJZ78273.1 inhibitor of the pro-sigma K processing machinery [Garciella nitratireducens DSM 15102]
MGLELEMEVIVAYVVGLVIIYVVGYALYKIFKKPLKLLGMLVFNGILGGMALLFVNFIGGFFDFSIAVNPITALVAGFLGIPGIVLMILLNTVL